MEIITPGEKISIISKCPVCKCKFKFSLEDIRARELSIFSSIYYIKCPNCSICGEVIIDELLSIIEDKEAAKEIIKEKKRGKRKNGRNKRIKRTKRMV